MIEKNQFAILEEDITDEFNHGIRVSNLVYYVAKSLGLYENQAQELAMAGMLHDIGKISLSAHLYGRDENSSDEEEMYYMRMHARLGYDILMRGDFSDFICETVLHHHENYDGSGYPGNLSGMQIPLGARILKVCDVYVALTSDRPYRKAFDSDTAVEMMIDEIKNYDLRVFLAFQRAIHDEEASAKWETLPGMNIQIIEEEES